MMSIRRNNGSALLIVMVVAISLGVLALSYFRVARENRHSEKWYELRSTAIEAARTIHEEAYATLHKDLKNPKSQAFWFMLGAVSGARNELKLPFASQNLGRIIPDGFSCRHSCELKIVSFKAASPDGRPYFGRNEGHGIVAIQTKVEIFGNRDRQRLPVAQYYLEMQHDYLVASMLSPDSNGSPFKNALMLRRQREHDGKNTISADNLQLLAYQTDAPPLPEKIENLQVFDRYALWARKDLTFEDLVRLRIIDPRTRALNLSGINHCRGTIRLDGQWQIRGQGVLIADSFEINDSIKKSEGSDLAIFYARRGKIRVNTGNEIHAALIAINQSGTGTVEAARPLNLNGMILADQLFFQNWSPDEHIIVYDRTLTETEKAYQISISRWVNYRRSGETS